MHDEVLAQHRNGDGGADLPEVIGRAAEVVAFGEDRDRRRTSAFVGGRPAARFEAVAEETPRGRSALHLCDHRQPGTRQRLDKGAARLERRGAELVEPVDHIREAPLNGGHDLLEHGATS